MSLFDWFKPIPQIEERAEVSEKDTNTVDAALLKALLNFGTIDRDKAMQIPEVAGCVKFIRNTIAQCPVYLYKEKTVDGRKVVSPLNDYRVAFLNDDTKSTMTGAQFKSALVEDYLLTGEGYAYINRKGTDIKSVNYVRSEAVAINYNSDEIFKTYTINVQGKIYQPWDFLKILRGSRTGWKGHGILEDNSDLLQVAYNTMLFENTLVSKGGNKKGFLQSSKRLTQEQINALKVAWQNLYSNNSDNVVVLNEGIEFKESSNSSVELQLNQNKETNAKEICRIFGVSQGVLDGSATEDEYVTTIKVAVMPILEELCQTLNRDLLLENEKGKKFFTFDTSELLKGDIEKRYKAYSEAVKSGWLSKNEIRYAENREAIDGLDVVSMSLGDVLFDMKSGRYFTPNTNSVTSIDGTSETEEPTENTGKEELE